MTDSTNDFRVMTSGAFTAAHFEMLPKVEALTTGDQLAEGTKMGPMIRERDAMRVESWVNEAVGAGAKRVRATPRNAAIASPDPLMPVAADLGGE